MSLSTENYPLDTRNKQLQEETMSPKIPAIGKRVPTIQNSAELGDSGSAMPMKQDTSSGYDESAGLSEGNVRLKFINNSSLGRDD